MKWDRANLRNATVAASIAGTNAACLALAPRYPVACFIFGTAINAWAFVMQVPLGQFSVPAPPPVEEAPAAA